MEVDKTGGISRFEGKQAELYKQISIEIERENQIHPNYADLHNQFGLLLIAEGDLEGAESHFLEALSLNPGYREATLNLGFLYIEMKRWGEAERLLISEARKHPRDGFLQHALGVMYLQTGRQKEALARIHKAILCHPYYRDYYHKKGVWHRGKVHLDPRKERIFKKTHLNYHYAQFHNFVGLYLAKKGKSTQAARELKKAAKLKPDEVLFHANLGTLYYYQAAGELKKAAKLKPDEVLFHANLGTVYYYQGAYRKAIQEYKKALKIDPHYGMGYANLSYTYGLISRTREALKYMEKAVRLHPRYADLHYNLALLYSDRKYYGKAISELRKALRINPNYLFARINVGVLYEEQKKWNEAKREYRKILQVTPENEDVRRRLERIS
jgi:Flp pilus assembly protein TadD